MQVDAFSVPRMGKSKASFMLAFVVIISIITTIYFLWKRKKAKG